MFRVTPRTATERNRVREHGDIWKPHDREHVKSGTRKLLVSVSTGHLRWWDNDQIEEIK